MEEGYLDSRQQGTDGQEAGGQAGQAYKWAGCPLTGQGLLGEESVRDPHIQERCDDAFHVPEHG